MPACGFCLSLQVFCMFLRDSVYLGASSVFHLLFLLDRATETDISILLTLFLKCITSCNKFLFSKEQLYLY